MELFLLLVINNAYLQHPAYHKTYCRMRAANMRKRGETGGAQPKSGTPLLLTQYFIHHFLCNSGSYRFKRECIISSSLLSVSIVLDQHLADISFVCHEFACYYHTSHVIVIH